jgi:hypothetical protein
MRLERGALCKELLAHVLLELAHFVICKTTLLLIIGSIRIIGAVMVMRTNLV